MKRVLTVQDISCLGKCSLTVALPVISAMGVETVILPTAVLSTHTLFPGFTYKDLSDQIEPITAHWQAQGAGFDAIYTGYLGTVTQIEQMKDLFRTFKTPDNLIFIDPVMADNGKLYANFDEAYVRANAGLCAQADIIVPNITEACLMTETEYRTEYDKTYIDTLLHRLALLGAKTVVLTGVSFSEGKTGVAGLDTSSGETTVYQNDLVNASYHGTGDLFSSVCVGAMMRGRTWPQAMQLAADYVALTIRATLEDPKKPWYGVNFEETLPVLMEMLKEETKA